MIPTKPTPADIQAAIVAAETGNWIDPSEEPVCWSCEITDEAGRHFCTGEAHSAVEAMALAWLNTWAPDALIAAYVEPGTVPFDVPDGFVFKLTPPWQANLSDLSIGNDFDFPLELPPRMPPQMPLCQCFHIVVGGERIGGLRDFGFTFLIEGEKLLPNGPIFIKRDPTAFIGCLCGVAPEAVAYVANKITEWSGPDDYERQAAFNIRNGRKLTDADLQRMRGATP